ncbi:MAG: adenosine deaminase [Ilumatobacteraceae bacterium]|nr:adenosine deaminase [Ilumatobacteraceae bacterium]
MRDLKALPKGHLHLHLELGMRPSTLADLAAKYDMEVPVIRGYGNFTAFSATCQATMETLRDRSDWERLADEICADGVADGAVYLELALWAGQYTAIWGSLEATWDIVLDVFDKAAAAHGITVRFMAPVDRVLDTPEEAMTIAELAISLKDRGVVSFGLHNDEVGHPPQDFVECFAVAKAGGLLITPHAGELEHGQFVKDSVDLLGADRIQHGVRSFEVDGLVEQLVEQGVCLDVCPTSNIMLSVFPGFAEHPLPRLLEAGVKVSINADDPLLFGPGLLDEYELCRREFGLTDEQLAFIARCSIECGGAPADLKADTLAGIDAWLAQPA